MAGIPGLDVFEDGMRTSGPRWSPGMSPEAQEWATANTGGARPQQPQGMRASPGGSWTDRLNQFAERTNANAGGMRSAVADRAAQANKFRTAADAAGRAALSSPAIRAAGVLGGALSTYADAKDTAKNLEEGNFVGALDSGLQTATGAGMALGGPAGIGLGAAYKVGHGVGTGVYKAMDATEGGRTALEGLGGGINGVLRNFGMGVDDSALRELNERGVNGMRPMDQLPRPEVAPQAAPVRAGPTAQNEADMAAARQAGVPAVQQPVGTDGQVMRSGNNFSGANIREGFNYADGQSPTTLGTVPAGSLGGSPLLDSRLADARMAAVDRGESLGDSGLGGVPYAPPTSLWRQELDAKNAATTQQSNEARAIALARSRGGGINPATFSAVMHAGDPNADRSAQERIASMRERGESQRAMASNALQAGMHRDANLVSLRGQDLTLQGHRMSNEVARAQMRRQQDNWEAEHGLRVQESQFKQRQDGADMLRRQIEAAVPRDRDDPSKPDGRAAQQMQTDISAAVAHLGLDHAGQLSPHDVQELTAASSLMAKLRNDGSALNPFAPDLLRTINPAMLTKLKVLPNGDRQVTARGNAAGYVIPKRYFTTEEANRVFPGTPTDRYNILSE